MTFNLEGTQTPTGTESAPARVTAPLSRWILSLNRGPEVLRWRGQRGSARAAKSNRLNRSNCQRLVGQRIQHLAHPLVQVGRRAVNHLHGLSRAVKQKHGRHRGNIAESLRCSSIGDRDLQVGAERIGDGTYLVF